MSWQFRKLEDVIAPTKGSLVSGPFGSSIGSRFFVDQGVPVIRGNNLSKGSERFKDDGFVFLTAEKAAEFRNCIALEDDIVFTAAGSIGQVGIIPKYGAFEFYIISNKQVRARINKEIADPLFVYLWLSSPQMVQHIESQNNGGAVPLLNLGIIRRLPVPLPELPIQKRIASILSAYDDLIENNRRRISLLEQAARLLYREWFVHLRFPGHETAKFVDGLPEGWTRCTVEDLLVLQRGFDLPVGDRKEGDVPVYGSTGIVGYHDEARVQAPAIVTGRSGSLGQVAISDLPCWPLNTALWVKELKRIPSSLAFCLLVSLELGKYNGGASVPTLDRKVVHRLPAVRPAADVADHFDAITSKTFEIASKLRAQNTKLTSARDLLLPRLMDGRIPV